MAHGIKGKVLLTGASGFIGGRLRDQLLSEGVDVVAIRRPGSPPARRGRSVEVDYADVKGLTRTMEAEQPTVVLHVAGATKGRVYEDFQRANVMPTRHLLAAAADAVPELSRFVLVSSLAAFGPSTPDRPLSESDPRKPIEFYGQSKLEAEQLVESESKVPWSIVRPSGVYGPGDVDYFNLFQSAARGVNVFFGNEHRWMSTVYVDDVIDGVLRAATNPNAVGNGYFLADGRPITWGDFQALVVQATRGKALTLRLPELLVGIAAAGGELATRFDGRPRLFNRQKAKMGAQEAWTCSAAAAEKDLGFAPQVLVEDGVPTTAAWYREQGWL